MEDDRRTKPAVYTEDELEFMWEENMFARAAAAAEEETENSSSTLSSSECLNWEEEETDFAVDCTTFLYIL